MLGKRLIRTVTLTLALGKLPPEMPLTLSLTPTQTQTLPLTLPLGKLPPEMLSEHATPIVAHLGDADADVREATLRARQPAKAG